jgi:hypothetical protein
MKTKSNRYTSMWLAALGLAVAREQLRAADFHVTTAQGLQNALTAAAHNGADNNIYLTNGYYEGNFNYNSSEANNLTLLPEPGVTNTAVTIDGAGVGSGLSISSSANSNTITVQGISFAIYTDHNIAEGALTIGAGSLASISVISCRLFETNDGGTYGLELTSGGNATVSDCTVTGLNPSEVGRGVYVSGPTGNSPCKTAPFQTSAVLGWIAKVEAPSRFQTTSLRAI